MGRRWNNFNLGPLSKERAVLDTPDQPNWRALDAEARARAYSPSSVLTKPLQAYLDWYVQESQTAYESLAGLQVLKYGAAPSQTLDFWHPSLDGLAPLHLFIHGGYWQELSKRESVFAAPYWLSQGAGFAALDYTLAPEATVHEIVQECVMALSYLQDNAASLGIDPTRIVISGSSAGAHLAAMTALKSERKPAGLILLSGVYDLEPLVGTYINDALGMDITDARALSPMGFDLAGFPDALLAWGEIETGEFKRQSRDFAERILSAGGKATVMEIKTRNHFDIVEQLTRPTEISDTLARFLQL